ncbi:MAG: hypothetical protein ABIN97_11195 [Ginsengibacter sp.]
MEIIIKKDTITEWRMQAIRVWRLATSDAHGLYKKFGFGTLSKPENLMELIK